MLFFYDILLLELNYFSEFPYASGPVFERGENYNNTTNAGLFAFSNPDGGVKSYRGFRPVLATLWYNKFFLPIKAILYGDCIGRIKEV